MADIGRPVIRTERVGINDAAPADLDTALEALANFDEGEATAETQPR